MDATMTTITTGKEKVGFLTLPPELRNRIYAEVFKQNIVDTDSNTVDVGSANTTPTLLKTCSRVYREAINFYHASTTFVCMKHDYEDVYNVTMPPKDLYKSWLKHLSAAACSNISIRFLTIFDYDHFEFLSGPDESRVKTFIEWGMFNHMATNAIIAMCELAKFGIPLDKIEVPWRHEGKEALWYEWIPLRRALDKMVPGAFQ